MSAGVKNFNIKWANSSDISKMYECSMKKIVTKDEVYQTFIHTLFKICRCSIPICNNIELFEILYKSSTNLWIYFTTVNVLDNALNIRYSKRRSNYDLCETWFEPLWNYKIRVMESMCDKKYIIINIILEIRKGEKYEFNLISDSNNNIKLNLTPLLLSEAINFDLIDSPSNSIDYDLKLIDKDQLSNIYMHHFPKNKSKFVKKFFISVNQIIKKKLNIKIILKVFGAALYLLKFCEPKLKIFNNNSYIIEYSKKVPLNEFNLLSCQTQFAKEFIKIILKTINNAYVLNLIILPKNETKIQLKN